MLGFLLKMQQTLFFSYKVSVISLVSSFFVFCELEYAVLLSILSLSVCDNHGIWRFKLIVIVISSSSCMLFMLFMSDGSCLYEFLEILCCFGSSIFLFLLGFLVM